jgi:hypothetical protein
MKRCLALLALILSPISILFAQDKADQPVVSDIQKPSRDFVMVQFTYNNWQNAPDSIKIGGVGRGFNAYICYDFPIKKSHFSFAAGVGVSTSNIYFKDQELAFTDTGAAGQQIGFGAESKSYKKYKLNTTYLEAPFELRYFGNKENRNRGFKAAVGLKVGTLIGAHTKGRYTIDGTKFTDKLNTRRYFESWSFAGTARAGWGNFSVVGTYNLNALFKENQGPAVVPYSIGICITGL